MVLPYNIGDIMKKKCKHCKEIKSLNEYFKASGTFDGKAGKCKICTVQLRKEWCKENPEKYKAQLERRKNNPWYKNKDNMKPKIEKQRENRKNLTDSYVMQLITSKGTAGENLDPEDISNEFLEVYRINLQIKRALKLTPKLKGEEDQP